jgi:anti-anti-sigma factor
MNPMFAHTFTSPGDILSTNADSIRPELFALTENLSAGATIHLDLSTARMIDSVGLNLIVSLLRRAKERKVRVRITVAHNAVKRMMTFTRIDQHAEIVSH